MSLKKQVQAFHPLNLYPALEGIADHWQEIKKEAIHSLSEMSYLADYRTRQKTWRVLPLQPEAEDVAMFTPAQIQFAQTNAPFTVNLLKSISGLKAFMFSVLAPQARIAPHEHGNPYVTAILTLQASGEVYIKNDGERRDFVEGEIIVFDYMLKHEVVNNSDQERIVLLLLLDNALV